MCGWLFSNYYNNFELINTSPVPAYQHFCSAVNAAREAFVPYAWNNSGIVTSHCAHVRFRATSSILGHAADALRIAVEHWPQSASTFPGSLLIHVSRRQLLPGPETGRDLAVVVKAASEECTVAVNRNSSVYRSNLHVQKQGEFQVN